MSTTYNGVIYQSISVDVSQPNEFAPLLVKQKDAYTRGYTITLTDNGEKLTIPTANTTAWFNCRNQTDPTKRASAMGTINSNGTVTVLVPTTVMDVAGYIQCDVSIITGSGDNANILKSTLFYLDCQVAANPEGTSSVAEDTILAGIVAGTIILPSGPYVNYVDLNANPDPDAPSSDPVKFATDPQTIYKANLKNPNNSNTSSNDVVCVKGSSLMSQYRIDTRGHVYTRSAGVAADPQWGDWTVPVNMVPSSIEVAGYALTGNVTPKMISGSMYENIPSDPVNGQTSTTGISGFKGKIVRSQASGRFYICYNTAASDDDPYLYWQAIPSAPQVWDYNTASQNNFTVPENYAGQLGDIIIMTTGATGKGGTIWMLERTVSAYGTTAYYWRELATTSDLASKMDRYISIANMTAAALEDIPRGQFFECQGTLCYRTANGYKVVSLGSEVTPSN